MAKTTEAENPDEEGDTIEVGLTEATHQQLLWFAQHQNYECSENDTQHKLYSRISAAWEHPSITVPRNIDDEGTTGKGPVRHDSHLPPFVKLKILSVGDDTKTEEYFALEGRTYRIQVGKVVSLPRDVFQSCILDAQEIRYRADGDTGLGEPQVVQAIAFTRVE